MNLSEIENLYWASVDPSERMELIAATLQLEEGEWQAVESFAAKVLLEDTNAIVRHEAAFVLGELRETGCINDEVGANALCLAATTDASSIVRHEAAESIYCFRGENVETLLKDLLEDEVEDVRLTAAMSLSWRYRYADWLTQELWATPAKVGANSD